MAKNKTRETQDSVIGFLETVKDEQKRRDCIAIADMITAQTGLEARMWGPAIVGFGSYHYKYESGREGDAPLTGFSPRANAIAFYFSANFENRDTLLQKLGKHKTGKGCVYIQKLADIDTGILREMIQKSTEHVRALYPTS